MSTGEHADTHHTDPLLEGVGHLVTTIFGHDVRTRANTSGILLCALMYAICCGAAFYAVELHLMKPFAPRLLAVTCVPVYALIYWLVRSGRTRDSKDPALMIPQNMFALLAIAFAYTAVGPHDRGVVMVLIALVMVFGMYAHRPKHSAIIGLATILLLGVCMAVLSRFDPLYYPPDVELIRFELLAGSVPSLAFSAYHIAGWRNRLAEQRRQLKITLEQVQQMATRDVLTGIYNRRYMQDKLDDSVKRFERYGESFTVAIIDLDHFKRVNDQHGHRVGDEALMAFASALGMVMRDTDIISRWGGEEFLLLLPNTSAHKAQIALERLRSALKELTVTATVPDLRIRFSAGIAVHDRASALTRTLERADRALYQAKAAGRDQSMTAPPDAS